MILRIAIELRGTMTFLPAAQSGGIGQPSEVPSKNKRSTLPGLPGGMPPPD